jgi:hypothetical protein
MCRQLSESCWLKREAAARKHPSDSITLSLRPRSPHPANVLRHHGLASLATEGLAELRHVLHHTVHAKLPRRMWIGLHLQSQLLRPRVPTPGLSVAEKELLDRRIAVLLAFKDELRITNRSINQIKPTTMFAVSSNFTRIAKPQSDPASPLSPPAAFRSQSPPNPESPSPRSA